METGGKRPALELQVNKIKVEKEHRADCQRHHQYISVKKQQNGFLRPAIVRGMGHAATSSV